MRRFLLITLPLSLAVGAALAQGRFRDHDEITAASLQLEAAVQNAGTTQADISVAGDLRVITSNGIPSHAVGRFPNGGNPHSIETQSVRVTVPLEPLATGVATPLEFGWNFGVSVDGVVFDPLAAEFWGGDPSSGWSYNALGGALNLGLDINYGHVQPNGAYHYHGVPTGLMETYGWSPDAHSPLIGYAADGFPIYALTGVVDGAVTEMTSSYRLIDGARPGGDAPGGIHDGTFNEDYVYVEGAGTLDICNGAMTVSAEYPEGTYAYFLSENYPVVPRCFAGTPDASFRLTRR